MTGIDRMCRRMRMALPALAGGDLPSPEARRVWRHLAACVPCREDYVACMRAQTAIADLSSDAAEAALAPAADARFFADLVKGVEHAVAAPRAATPRGSGSWLWRAGAAAALVIVGLGLAVFGFLEAAPASIESGLLGRDRLDVPVTSSGSMRGLTPLAYQQGLEAQRYLLEYFEGSADGFALATVADTGPAPAQARRRR